MDTQNTPIHIRLWHRDFWNLLLSNLFVTSAVYIFLPVLPFWMADTLEIPLSKTACLFVAYALGLFVLGGFCSHFVERYRRNKVCLTAIVLTLFCVASLPLLGHVGVEDRYLLLVAGSFLVGCFFGLSQTVLYSTLAIDISESLHRTEANHAIMWFGRFALSLGPVLGLFLWNSYGVRYVVYGSLACGITGALFLRMVKFSFKTPSEVDSIYSLDRFLLPKAAWLFLNEFLVMASVGIMLSTVPSPRFYALLMAGFFLALLAERFAFADANLRSEMTSGLILIIAALLLMLFRRTGPEVYFVPVMMGIGIGLTASRILLFSVKLRGHCERGTALSNYFHSWETGLALGYGAGLCVGTDLRICCLSSLALSILALLLYHFIVHSWYMRNKNK